MGTVPGGAARPRTAGVPARGHLRLKGIRLLGQRGPRQGGRPGVPRRPRLARPVVFTPLRADGKGQPRSPGIADVDALAVVNVDDGHPVAVQVGPVERTVVDCQPPSLIEAQDQVRPRDSGIRDAHVGLGVAPDDHFVAGGEGTLGPVVPNRQEGRGGAGHYSSIGRRRACSPSDSPVIWLCLGAATHSYLIACGRQSPTPIRHHSNVGTARRTVSGRGDHATARGRRSASGHGDAGRCRRE